MSLPPLLMLDEDQSPDWEATAQAVTGFAPGWSLEAVAGWLPAIDDWCDSEGEKTVFEFARYIKGRCLHKKFAHDPGNHSETLWTAIMAASLLYVQSDFQFSFELPTFAEEFGPAAGWESDYLDTEGLALHWEEAWCRVKYGKGEDRLTKCANLARAEAPTFSDNPRYGLLLAVASRLAKESAPEPFLLPQVRLAEALGIPQPTVSMLINKAVREKWLQRVSNANREANLAARYRFTDRRPKAKGKA